MSKAKNAVSANKAKAVTIVTVGKIDKLATPATAKLPRKGGWATVGLVDKTAKLEWVVTTCPKRPGTASGERAAAYWSAKTVGDYLAAGGTRLDLSWDMGHKFLRVLP